MNSERLLRTKPSLTVGLARLNGKGPVKRLSRQLLSQYVMSWCVKQEAGEQWWKSAYSDVFCRMQRVLPASCGKGLAANLAPTFISP